MSLRHRHSLHNTLSRPRWLFLLMTLLVVGGGLFGGGPTSPIMTMGVELLACVLLGVAVTGIANGEWPRQAWAALIFLLLIAALGVVQLVPLPPTLWQSLPGRGVPTAIAQIAGQAQLWRPLSLTPEQTRMQALALTVPMATFLTTLQLDARARDRIIALLVLSAFASAILGVVQVATGDFYLFASTHVGYPVGFFANRNHAADLLLIAMPLSAQLITTSHLPRQQRHLATLCMVGFFAVAVIATQSRTALTLLPVGLFGAFLIGSERLSKRTMIAAIGAGGAVVVLGVALLTLTPVGHHALARFNDVAGDLRPQIWQATFTAIQNFWPVGSGIGSFTPVYQMFEDLDYLSPDWVNHAHNDYLEIILETGIAGCALFAAFAVLLLSRLLARPADGQEKQRLAGMFSLAILLLHSLTDYPLRTSLLVIAFAFSGGLLYPAKPRTKRARVRTASSTMSDATALTEDQR